MDSTPRVVGPRIYNLFPLLAGKMPEWRPQLERAHQMRFNWVFVNPFHLPGLSGSLYSIKDYYQFHPLLVAPEAGPPLEQLSGVIEQTHRLGMKIMMDLVINHTAIDSPLVQAHPDWYQRGSDGEVVHPGAMADDHWVSWGDLASINNAASPDRENLWQYWRDLVSHHARRGFDGFRCDAAYQVPSDLWRFLLRSVRKDYPQVQFFAESLGCTPEQTLELAEAGFDFIFNS
ncbi:MAG: hypothetical protein HY647_01310 [Acidobacteria bacterium]|nr:hypothetical protein [Acidobacteriota bacterium]